MLVKGDTGWLIVRETSAGLNFPKNNVRPGFGDWAEGEKVGFAMGACPFFLGLSFDELIKGST